MQLIRFETRVLELGGVCLGKVKEVGDVVGAESVDSR